MAVEKSNPLFYACDDHRAGCVFEIHRCYAVVAASRHEQLLPESARLFKLSDGREWKINLGNDSQQFCTYNCSCTLFVACALLQRALRLQVLDQFVLNFGSSSIGLDGLGRISYQNLAGSTYQERVFGDFTCSVCLDGVPVSRNSGDERYLC